MVIRVAGVQPLFDDVDSRWRFRLSRCVVGVVLAGGVAACQDAEPAAVPDATDAPGAADARVQPVDPRTQFIGTWRLARVERSDQRGAPLPDFVHDAIGVGESLGYLMYDGERMGTVLQQETRTPSDGQGDDALAAVESYAAYFGRYSVDEAGGYLSHQVAGSLNPSGAGGDTQPFYELSGNQLVLTPSLQCPDSFLTGRGCGYGTTGVQLRNVWEKLNRSTAAVDDERRFFGFWEIDRVERRSIDGDGEEGPTEQYAAGYLIYMPSGYMAVHLMRPDRDAYERTRPTPAEADATMRGYVSYAGPFTVDAEQRVVVHHQEAHLDPNRVGGDARRGFEFRDDQLILEPPVSTLDGRQFQTRVFWNRLSALDTDIANAGNHSGC